VIILGARVWDDIFEIMMKVRDHYEYPEEWRGRLYARRILRFLQKQGCKAILENDWLLSKKRMAQLSGFGNFGKNTLIINPTYGPWFRLRSILTNAVLVPDKPFTQDLCGDCEDCVKACPVGALTPYKVDPDKCLLGLTWAQRQSPEYSELWKKHCPQLTDNTYVMCTTCQRACKYGRELRGPGKI
jgi:epoxyqueuosine reductase QueG